MVNETVILQTFLKRIGQDRANTTLSIAIVAMDLGYLLDAQVRVFRGKTLYHSAPMILDICLVVMYNRFSWGRLVENNLLRYNQGLMVCEVVVVGSTYFPFPGHLNKSRVFGECCSVEIGENWNTCQVCSTLFKRPHTNYLYSYLL